MKSGIPKFSRWRRNAGADRAHWASVWTLGAGVAVLVAISFGVHGASLLPLLGIVAALFTGMARYVYVRSLKEALLRIPTVPTSFDQYCVQVQFKFGDYRSADWGYLALDPGGWLHFTGIESEFSLRSLDLSIGMAVRYDSDIELELIFSPVDWFVVGRSPGWVTNAKLKNALKEWRAAPHQTEGESLLPPLEPVPLRPLHWLVLVAWLSLVCTTIGWSIVALSHTSGEDSMVLFAAMRCLTSIAPVWPALNYFQFRKKLKVLSALLARRRELEERAEEPSPIRVISTSPETVNQSV